VAALRHVARAHGIRADLLAATERVNSRQRSWPLHAMQRDLGGPRGLRGLHVALWGLSFKPGTDDMREAPSLTLIERLCAEGFRWRCTTLPQFPVRARCWATRARCAGATVHGPRSRTPTCCCS